MEEKLVALLRAKNMTITTAESCTGGMIASKIVNVAGASDVLNEGFITYANSAKETYCGVRHTTLEKCGAVSKEVALEMAEGVAKKTGADVAISVTGIAGPGGGTTEKPVGLVYIGCFCRGRLCFEKHIFQGDRLTIREKSTYAALSLAVKMISEQEYL